MPYAAVSTLDTALTYVLAGRSTDILFRRRRFQSASAALSMTQTVGEIIVRGNLGSLKGM